MSIRCWMLSAPLLAVTGLYVILETQDSAPTSRNLIALGAPTIVSLAVFAWVDKVNYDMLLPNGGYLTYGFRIQHFWTKIDIGILGLFLDRTFGLLPVAPIFVLGIAGAFLALRTQVRRAAVLLVPAAVYILFIASSRFWYGDYTPPARLITGAAALLAPFASLVIGERTRWQSALLISWTWLMSYIMCAVPLSRWPSLWDINVSGVAELFRERWGVNALAIFPSLLRADQSDQLLALLWALIVVLIVWWLVVRRVKNDPFTTRDRI